MVPAVARIGSKPSGFQDPPFPSPLDLGRSHTFYLEDLGHFNVQASSSPCYLSRHNTKLQAVEDNLLL